MQSDMYTYENDEALGRVLFEAYYGTPLPPAVAEWSGLDRERWPRVVQAVRHALAAERTTAQTAQLSERVTLLEDALRVAENALNSWWPPEEDERLAAHGHPRNPYLVSVRRAIMLALATSPPPAPQEAGDAS